VSVVKFIEVVFGAVATGDCFLELRLLRGGVALHWVEVPAGMSTSMGDALVGGVVDAAAAYEREAVVVSMAGTAREAGEGSVSMGVKNGSLVHLEAGVLAEVGGAKERKEASILLGGASLALALGHGAREKGPARGVVGVLGDPGKSVGGALVVGLLHFFCKVGAKRKKGTPECRRRTKLLCPLRNGSPRWREDHFGWGTEKLGERGSGRGLYKFR